MSAAGAGWSFSSPDERSAAAGLLLLASSPTATPSSASSSASRSSASLGSAAAAARGVWLHCQVAADSVEEQCPSSSSTSSSPLAPFSSSSTVSDVAHEIAAGAVCGAFEGDPLRLLDVAARCIDVKRKVVRKARSAVVYGGISKKSIKNERRMPQQRGNQNQEEDPDPSCLSSASTVALAVGSIPATSPSFSGSSSSGAANSSSHGGLQISQNLPQSSPVSAISGRVSCGSSAGKRVLMKMMRVAGKYATVDGSGSGTVICRSSGVRRRADAILDFLWKKGCTSEVKIRAVLGDSPDTSKALRMLVKLDQVKRSGTGGRQNPFLYWVSESVDGSIL